MIIQPQSGCVISWRLKPAQLKPAATALRLDLKSFPPRVAETATLG